MKHVYLLACLIAFNVILHAQIKDPKATEVWEPEPSVVDPGNGMKAPSDAIPLPISAWTHKDGSDVKWQNENGVMTVARGSGPIFTKEKFADCQLHIEWRAPTVIKGEGQGRGNSGIFLQNKYEIQVLDSYENRTYSNGQAGSIYKQAMPLVNAMNPPGEWNSYDIIYKAPHFNSDGIKVASAYVTVLHNGVLIQNHLEIKGTTPYIGLPKNPSHEDDVIQIQDHGNPVSFRNMWIRKL